MLLQALVNYYNILAEEEKSDIPKQGYGKVKISYALVLSEDGTLISLPPLKVPADKGGKYIPRDMVVPEQVKRSVGILANFLCDNSSYVLGVDNKEKPERSKNCFLAFKSLHETILEGLDCVEAKAVLSFLQNWDVGYCTQNPVLADYSDDLYGGANFVFKLDGVNTYVHQNSLIQKAWEKYKGSLSEGSNTAQCLVSGEKSPIARLHPTIKGIRGGQAMGNSLVSFNSPAYESYGKEQGMNAPVGEYAAFAYGTVLNILLADNSHKLSFGDATVVFWAESKESNLYQDIFSLFSEPDELQAVDTGKQRYVRDHYAVDIVKEIFQKISLGKQINSDFSFDPNTKFYILGLSPNAARISIRFFLRNNFGTFLNRFYEHYENLAIEKQFEKEADSISLWRILNETVAPSSTDKSASPILSGALLRAILTGAPYPAALFNAIMLRIRAEKDINYYKAAVIKAYLLRCKNKQDYKEVLTLSLNPISDNKSYVLGRLFAALEQAQKNASSSAINTTIKDKYFTSACANPAITFPIILRLSNHHISKSEYGYFDEERISEIMQLLDVEKTPFPKNLSLEEQGIFVLGYYHQKNKMFADIMEKAKAKKIKKSEEK